MSEEPNLTNYTELPSAKELMHSLDSALKQHEETENLDTFTEQEETQLREQAEKEVFADTRAKELLWDAKKTIDNFRGDNIYQVALAELVEAYAVIAPEDGELILRKLIHDQYFTPPSITGERGVVEALAKYGHITGLDTYIDEARNISQEGKDTRSIDTESYDEKVKIRDAEIKGNLETVALFGHDIESMHALFDRAKSRHYVRHEQEIPPTLYFYDLAAMGYMPAIEVTKRRLRDLITDDTFNIRRGLREDEYETFDKAIAGIILVEKRVHDGDIEATSTTSDEKKAKKGIKYDLDQEWWKLVSERREGVLQHLQKPELLLPHFKDSLEKALEELLDDEEQIYELIEKTREELNGKDPKSILGKIQADSNTDKARLLLIVRAIKEEALRLQQEEI